MTFTHASGVLVLTAATLAGGPVALADSATPAAQTAAKMAPLRNSPTQAWEEQIIKVPYVGTATAYVPKHAAATHVVLFASGDGGWNLGVVDMARRIADRAIVIGFSYPALRRAQPASLQCWFPAGDLEEIAHAAERDLGLPEYHPPILLGYSSGATLVYGALVEAPPTAFAGGLSLGFCPDLPSNHHVCDAGDWKPTYDVKHTSAILPKVTSLPHDWYVLLGVEDQVCNPPAVHAFMDGMQNAHLIDVPHTGHGFGNQPRWAPPFDDSIKKLLDADTGGSAPPPAPPAPSAAALQHTLEGLSLPLQYEWAATPRAALIFISGDGGWAALDQGVASYVSARGVSVVGLSTIKYFWGKKTPEQTGSDLTRVADALAGTHLPLFVGGYSFGAEVTPFALGTWTADQRRRVAGEVLVAPGPTASFQVNVLDWVRTPKATPLVVADRVRSLDVPTLCIGGQKEAASESGCASLSAAVVVRLPGSHHFNGNYDAVGAEVVKFIDARLAAR